MPYIRPELIEEAKKVDLLTYLQKYEPNELVHFSGNTYTTKTHDSLKISNGLWNWFSKGIGGKNAIDYLVKVKNYTFIQAVESVLNCNINKTGVINQTNKKVQYSKLIIPEKDINNDKVKEYLIRRGIDKDIIDYCIDNEIIYQEKTTKNLVFVGYDNENKPRYIGCRATNKSRFMKDATGSDKSYSFRLKSKLKSDTVHLFESAIDLLSYATLLKINNKEWYNENMISLAGVYQPAKIIEQSKVPLALELFLKNNPNIRNIILHLDRDKAGIDATKAITILMSKDYNIVDKSVPIGKDVNDYLCFKLGINKIENKERNR